MMFSKSFCPYCKKAKATLKELNVEPGICELDEDCKCYGIVIILILVIKY